MMMVGRRRRRWKPGSQGRAGPHLPINTRVTEESLHSTFFLDEPVQFTKHTFNPQQSTPVSLKKVCCTVLTLGVVSLKKTNTIYKA